MKINREHLFYSENHCTQSGNFNQRGHKMLHIQHLVYRLTDRSTGPKQYALSFGKGDIKIGQYCI